MEQSGNKFGPLETEVALHTNQLKELLQQARAENFKIPKYSKLLAEMMFNSSCFFLSQMSIEQLNEYKPGQKTASVEEFLSSPIRRFIRHSDNLKMFVTNSMSIANETDKVAMLKLWLDVMNELKKRGDYNSLEEVYNGLFSSKAIKKYGDQLSSDEKKLISEIDGMFNWNKEPYENITKSVSKALENKKLLIPPFMMITKEVGKINAFSAQSKDTSSDLLQKLNSQKVIDLSQGLKVLLSNIHSNLPKNIKPPQMPMQKDESRSSIDIKNRSNSDVSNQSRKDSNATNSAKTTAETLPREGAGVKIVHEQISEARKRTGSDPLMMLESQIETMTRLLSETKAKLKNADKKDKPIIDRQILDLSIEISLKKADLMSRNLAKLQLELGNNPNDLKLIAAKESYMDKHMAFLNEAISGMMEKMRDRNMTDAERENTFKMLQSAKGQLIKTQDAVIDVQIKLIQMTRDPDDLIEKYSRNVFDSMSIISKRLDEINMQTQQNIKTTPETISELNVLYDKLQQQKQLV